MAGSELLVLNPRRRRRAKATHRRRARRGTAKRRRRRSYAVVRHNPRRHVRRHRGHVRRRRRAVRNPRMLGIPLGQIAMFATGGIITEVLADKLAKMLPATWNADPNMVRIGTKAAVGIGVPLLARKFLPRGWGNAIAIGGGVVTLLDIIKTYVAPMIPGLTLSSYEVGPAGSPIAPLALSGDDGMSGSVYQGGTYS